MFNKKLLIFKKLVYNNYCISLPYNKKYNRKYQYYINEILLLELKNITNLVYFFK